MSHKLRGGMPRSCSWWPMPSSKTSFLRHNMAPCWPHVSRQHEPMLDAQHGPMLEANMDLFWKPTWTYFGNQHGPIFCLQTLKHQYFQGLDFGASRPGLKRFFDIFFDM